MTDIDVVATLTSDTCDTSDPEQLRRGCKWVADFNPEWQASVWNRTLMRWCHADGTPEPDYHDEDAHDDYFWHGPLVVRRWSDGDGVADTDGVPEWLR